MFKNVCRKFFQRYHKLELSIIGVFLLSIMIVMGILWWLRQEKFNEIVFSFGSCTAFVLVLFLLGTYFIAPYLFRNLIALIAKQKIEKVVGPLLNNEDDIEKPWEQQRDLAIADSTPTLHISEEKGNKNSRLFEAVASFKQDKYILVISMKEDVLAEIQEEKEEALYRLLLEMSYNKVDEYNIEDRIDNLILLCNKFRQNFPAHLVMSFQCNLAWIYARNQQIENATNVLVDIFKRVNSKEYKLSHEEYAKINDLQSTILLKKQHPALALSYLKRAWSFSTDSAWYEFKIARIYYNKLNFPEKALEYAKNAFSHLKESDGTDLYETLVSMCFYLEAFLGNYQNAYDFIDRSTIQTSHILACKAYISTKLEKYNEAFQLAQKVIDQDPSESTAFNAKGIALLHKKEYTAAERCFSVVLPEFEKENDMYIRYYTSEVYYHRGICNIHLNNLEQAKLDFRRAEELGYTDFEANYLDTIHRYIVEHNETEPNK